MIKKSFFIFSAFLVFSLGLVGCQSGNSSTGTTSSEESTASGPIQVDEDLDFEEEVGTDQGFGGQ